MGGHTTKVVAGSATRQGPGIGVFALAFLLAAGFTVGAMLQPRALGWSRRAESDDAVKLLFGEGRRLFAEQFFRRADVYFHSGYYPSIFDQGAENKSPNRGHLAGAGREHEEHSDHGPTGETAQDHADEDSEHYRQMARKEPRDWIEAFGRRFTVNAHAHLSAGNEREMLPWLRLSAEMDPQRVETYTVAAYWLRGLGKTREAEDFLRLGLRHNPENYEILFELGLVKEEQRDDERARNLWRTALKRWLEQEEGKQDADFNGFDRIAVRLAKLEERHGDLDAARICLLAAQARTKHPEAIAQLLANLGPK